VACQLRAPGLAVTLGVLERECREQHRGFLSVCSRGRPFVALKLASSLERPHRSQAASRAGSPARPALRAPPARADGRRDGRSGTALADDPS
jgi:diaminohydroxyphosphoribosylaminopyrimidine deaminase/5-amino-6-(5-phosphoribosylamino)uracil reductase